MLGGSKTPTYNGCFRFQLLLLLPPPFCAKKMSQLPAQFLAPSDLRNRLGWLVGLVLFFDLSEEH